MRHLTTQTSIASAGLALLLLLSACSSMPGEKDPDMADLGIDAPRAITDQGLQRHLYVAAGMGASDLEPDTSEVPGTDVRDSSDMGMQFTIGKDITRTWSLEGHFAQLGDADVSSPSPSINNGTIDYTTFGVSGLYYLGGARTRFKRHGATAFLRGGIGMLQNQADDDIRYEQDNSVHLLLGAGVEASHRSGLALRGELISYEGDANYLQAALLYRFGRQPRHRQLVEAEPVMETDVVVAAEPEVALVSPVAAIAVIDSDKDGIVDGQDNCPGTTSGLVVDDRGCPLYNGTLEVVNFHTNSANLTVAAMAILDGVVSTLNLYLDVAVEISAHTDSMGDASYNQALSERRSQAVVEYLIQNGVQGERLNAKAYGESRPIADNMKAAGRAKNRRVELTARR